MSVPSDLVTEQVIVNLDDCEVGVIVKYATEKVLVVKIVYETAEAVGATKLQMYTVIARLVEIVVQEVRQYFKLSERVPT